MNAIVNSRAQQLHDQYFFQTSLIRQHVDGVSDAESLLQLPFNANCLNWIVGHILSRRHSALETLGSGPLWSNDALALYRSGSEPITQGTQSIAFSTLLDDLDRSMDMLSFALQSADDEALDRIVENDRGKKPAAQHLEGFLWHENYHIGQLDILQAFVQSTRSDPPGG